MKPIQFEGDSLKQLRGVPKPVRDDLGYQLYLVQRGKQPLDFKPMPSVGPGVEEIRVRDASGAYRAMYTARFAEAVYVLHVFQKKTRATSSQDIELAAKRHAALLRRRR
jgi:phage-related protein